MTDHQGSSKQIMTGLKRFRIEEFLLTEAQPATIWSMEK